MDRVKPDLKLINDSGKTYSLVRPGDGSTTKERTPMVGYSAVKHDSDEVHPEEVPNMRDKFCGNIDAYDADEVFALAPSERIQLAGLLPWIEVPEPGIYRVTYYYRNDPEKKMEDDGLILGEHAPGVEEAISKSSPVFLTSNEVRLTVFKHPLEALLRELRSGNPEPQSDLPNS